MKRERPSRGIRRPLASDHFENSETLGRAAPRLVIEVVLEELPRVEVRAETAEDEIRLTSWATNPATIQRLRDALADTLDELCEAA